MEPSKAALQRDFMGHVGHPLQITQLFDCLPGVYLFIKDKEHRFMRVNQALWELHGCSAEGDMIGKTDFDFHPPALAGQYIEEDQAVMRSKQAFVDRAWLVLGADGVPCWYLCTKIPLTDLKSRVIGLAGVLRPLDRSSKAPAEFQRLTPVIDFVTARYSERITVTEMAACAHLSESQLQREFQRLFAMSPSEYLLRARLLMARRSLEQSRDSVGKIALDCGFYDQSHFTRAFRAATGMRPLEYRHRFAPTVA